MVHRESVSARGNNRMELLSVNVSLPTTVRHARRVVTTGIFKKPVRGSVMLRKIGGRRALCRSSPRQPVGTAHLENGLETVEREEPSSFEPSRLRFV